MSSVTPVTPTRVIVNPAAAGGRARHVWEGIAAAAGAALGPLDVVYTTARREATTLATAAAREGCSLVIAVGGDGTVGEVVDGLMADPADAATRPALGIVMVGTGADLARTLGLPADANAQVLRIAEGRVRTLDVVRASFVADDGQPCARHFLNVGGFGLSGATDRFVNRRKWSKWLGAKVAFQLGVLEALCRWRNAPVTIRVDDQPALSVAARVVVVANGRWFGGGMLIAPHAAPDDGALDLVVIGDISAWRLLRRLPTVYRGGHLGFPEVHVARGRSITAWPAGDREVPIDLDGESPGILPATFDIVPGALRVRA